jgi:hypothetical protein
MMKRLLFGLVAAGSLAAIGAPAAGATGTGGYAVFAQCPLHAEGVNACIYSPTESGEVKIGKQTVPIERTQVLQGGMSRIIGIPQSCS